MKKRNLPHRAREVRTKDMLLPLTAAAVRSISLENHLALAAMRSGNGTPDTMVSLLRVLYMTYFLCRNDCPEQDLALFLSAELALDESIRAATMGLDWQLRAEQIPLIEQVLVRADELIASVPKYRYVDAWKQLESFSRSDRASVLPGSQLKMVSK
ncbi:hypothetical protein [Paraburkholderia sp. SIMBA_027]|uniref:hypothetical protein n=1 Tax=Paraburkholderia sp. SIMBA_027 TaxID=3085770 RepID=UPI00397DD2A9